MTKEWDMVQELYEMIDELLTPAQQEMVENWVKFLDPHLPFLEQQSTEQERWLYYLYEYYVNGDKEAARDYYDED